MALIDPKETTATDRTLAVTSSGYLVFDQSALSRTLKHPALSASTDLYKNQTSRPCHRIRLGHFIQTLFDEDLGVGVPHCLRLQHLLQVSQVSAAIQMPTDPLLDPLPANLSKAWLPPNLWMAKVTIATVSVDSAAQPRRIEDTGFTASSFMPFLASC